MRKCCTMVMFLYIFRDIMVRAVENTPKYDIVFVTPLGKQGADMKVTSVDLDALHKNLESLRKEVRSLKGKRICLGSNFAFGQKSAIELCFPCRLSSLYLFGENWNICDIFQNAKLVFVLVLHQSGFKSLGMNKINDSGHIVNAANRFTALLRHFKISQKQL